METFRNSHINNLLHRLKKGNNGRTGTTNSHLQAAARIAAQRRTNERHRNRHRPFAKRTFCLICQRPACFRCLSGARRFRPSACGRACAREQPFTQTPDGIVKQHVPQPHEIPCTGQHPWKATTILPQIIRKIICYLRQQIKRTGGHVHVLQLLLFAPYPKSRTLLLQRFRRKRLFCRWTEKRAWCHSRRHRHCPRTTNHIPAVKAFQDPDFSLVSVYLQLPFLERIQYLRGLYLVPDYNQNPIARRIVLVKQAEHYNPEAFAQLEARLIPQNEFNTEEQLLYNYTCGDSDSIKMCTLPSPKLDLRDLQGEKDLLDLYASTNEKNANE